MRISEKYYDQIFDFEGAWGMASRCGLRIVNRTGKTAVIVTELYLDNPGTSITSAGRALAEQICRAHELNIDSIQYIECNPDMNSKLSFYDESFFEVKFDRESHPVYRKLEKSELDELLGDAPHDIPPSNTGR